MAKKIKYQLIRIRRSYSTRELSETLRVHLSTVRSWMHLGMRPIDVTSRPYLFMGSQVKDFLRSRAKASKCSLGPDQFYCPRCKSSVRARPGSVWFDKTGRRLGLTDWQVIVRGRCVNCDCSLCRFSSEARLRESVWADKYTDKARRLCGTSCTSSNTHVEKETAPANKTGQ